MSEKRDEPDVYIIPPNFIESSSIFGGDIKLRNLIEAGVLVLASGYPVLNLPFTITSRIMIACVIILPLGIFGIIGINGESLTSFLFNFIKFVFNRRILGINKLKNKSSLKKEDKNKISFFIEQAKEKSDPKNKESKILVTKKDKFSLRRTYIKTTNEVSDYIEIEKIKNGIVYTKDNRYIKILEIEPINFLLRNSREQKSIIYSFIGFLKISPVKLQFKVLTKRADINAHIQKIEADMKTEEDFRCRNLQEEYINLIRRIGQREAISRRFFLIFEYETGYGIKAKEIENDAVSQLNTVTGTAKNYLRQCGNEVIVHGSENELALEVFYNILNRNKSIDTTFQEHISEVLEKHMENSKKEIASLKDIPITDLISPQNIDFSRGGYIVIDGIYQAYLTIPSEGYKPHVLAGWTSLLINAGEGIDTDIFFFRQDKEKIQRKLGQQIRINRARIKDTSDTNEDFDSLGDAIRSGYFLKRGISNNEDFYYMCIFITVTAHSKDELEWRVNEMRKLMASQDLNIYKCTFRQEQAFLSTLPMLKINDFLYNRSKRNTLTLGAASSYPLTSFEMSDDNGILLGVNKHNNSMIIVDIFNSKMYKNANIAIMGTSGAGKTFLIQLMALRMRLKNIQVFIISPLKGHEFYRACANIGGEFIQVSPASKTCINVMEIRKTDSIAHELIDGDVIEKSKLASKIQSLHIFFSLLIPDINHEERQLLDEALIRTYEKKGITHNNDSLVNENISAEYKEMPVLGDLYEILIEKSETKRLANILNRLVNGSAKSFNQQTNVNLNNKYTVLDISELTGDLLIVGMFVALDFVWDKAKENRTKEKAIFLDELWKLIGSSSNKMAAEYVLEIFKIIRGYGGSAICGTQDINDFFALDDGKYGKGIINNSKTKIVLNLEEEEAERVQGILRLSEAEMMAITHFERGNGLISTNNNNVTVEFKSSGLEKELITTDRRELQEILSKKKTSE